MTLHCRVRVAFIKHCLIFQFTRYIYGLCIAELLVEVVARNHEALDLAAESVLLHAVVVIGDSTSMASYVWSTGSRSIKCLSLARALHIEKREHVVGQGSSGIKDRPTRPSRPIEDIIGFNRRGLLLHQVPTKGHPTTPCFCNHSAAVCQYFRQVPLSNRQRKAAASHPHYNPAA
jgi:hypothetical protein